MIYLEYTKYKKEEEVLFLVTATKGKISHCYFNYILIKLT